jgi:hypothetical protein
MNFLIQDIGRILVAWTAVGRDEQNDEGDRTDFDHV